MKLSIKAKVILGAAALLMQFSAMGMDWVEPNYQAFTLHHSPNCTTSTVTVTWDAPQPAGGAICALSYKAELVLLYSATEAGPYIVAERKNTSEKTAVFVVQNNGYYRVLGTTFATANCGTAVPETGSFAIEKAMGKRPIAVQGLHPAITGAMDFSLGTVFEKTESFPAPVYRFAACGQMPIQNKTEGATELVWTLTNAHTNAVVATKTTPSQATMDIAAVFPEMQKAATYIVSVTPKMNCQTARPQAFYIETVEDETPKTGLATQQCTAHHSNGRERGITKKIHTNMVVLGNPTITLQLPNMNGITSLFQIDQFDEAGNFVKNLVNSPLPTPSYPNGAAQRTLNLNTVAPKVNGMGGYFTEDLANGLPYQYEARLITTDACGHTTTATLPFLMDATLKEEVNNTFLTKTPQEVMEQKSVLAIVPNPFSSVLYVQYELSVPEALSFRLFDAKGSTILVQSLPATQASGSHSIATAQLPAGVYGYELMNSQGHWSGKLVKP
jgi:hypothetical protein